MGVRSYTPRTKKKVTWQVSGARPISRIKKEIYISRTELRECRVLRLHGKLYHREQGKVVNYASRKSHMSETHVKSDGFRTLVKLTTNGPGQLQVWETLPYGTSHGDHYVDGSVNTARLKDRHIPGTHKNGISGNQGL